MVYHLLVNVWFGVNNKQIVLNLLFFEVASATHFMTFKVFLSDKQTTSRDKMDNFARQKIKHK